jgi:hypothetical protein
MSLFTPPPPDYTGDPGTGTGGQGAPNIVKTITLTVLSPALSPPTTTTAPPPTAAAEVTSSKQHHVKNVALIDTATAPPMPGPVAKSQPLVIAVPDNAKSYKITGGSIAFPAAATAGIVPPIPAAAPVGLDQPPQGALQSTDSQIQITVSWMILPGASGANAGDYRTLLTVTFYDQ